MEKFSKHSSKLVPLPLNDVDTDAIIPAEFLTSIGRDGFGENLFRRLRDNDADFPLNLSQYQEASVLLAGRNFGCGSSREHAVWAFLGAGFRAIIAKSFADIFSSNSAKNGLVLITQPENVVDQMLSTAQAGEAKIDIDLEQQQICLDGAEKFHFDFDPFRKHCILNGLDDIDYILSKEDEIKAFRQKQEEKRFFSSIRAL